MANISLTFFSKLGLGSASMLKKKWLDPILIIIPGSWDSFIMCKMIILGL